MHKGGIISDYPSWSFQEQVNQTKTLKEYKSSGDPGQISQSFFLPMSIYKMEITNLYHRIDMGFNVLVFIKYIKLCWLKIKKKLEILNKSRT